MNIKAAKLINEDSLHEQNKTEALAYWKNLLAGYEGIANLFSDTCQVEDGRAFDYLEMMLDKKTITRLHDLAMESGISIGSISETVWGILLHKYNRTDDSVFGKFASGKTAAGISGKKEETFYNVVPCRVNTKQGMRICDLLREVDKQSNDGEIYFRTDLKDIQNEIGQGPELLSTLLVFLPVLSLQEIPGHLSAGLEAARKENEYSVILYITSFKDAICVRVEYDPKKYFSKDIERLLQRIERIYGQIAYNADILVEELELITEKERDLILRKFNNTKVNYDKYKTIIELFEEQVEKSPNKTAIMYKDEKLTYRQFNEKANQLAFKIRRQGVKPNDYVAIIAQRGMEMIIGIYGIIKAGCAYVPVDPGFPQERIQYILKDCQPKAVVTYQVGIETDIPIIDLMSKQIFTGTSENPQHVNKPDDLVYCIYTSGTSGKPKGVMIEHRSLFNHIKVTAKKLYQDDVRLTPLFTNYCFDFTVPMIFVSMLYGGTLVLFQNEKGLVKYLNAGFYFSMLKITPSLFNALSIGFKNKLNIKNIVFGGETLNRDFVVQICDFLPEDTIIHNEYGPTEATVFATENVIERNQKIITIGKPIWNTQVYILNGMQLCGIKMAGELCIAGDGVARGYLNQSEMTAEKYIKNPFGQGLLYRTGDLARWMSDGNIEFLGRIDEQIKIRGFRVELEEIESRLRAIADIKNVAVIARENDWGSKILYAYVVADKQIDMGDLRKRLSGELPYYMLPHIVQMEALPITTNGKIDKKRLYEMK